MALRVTSLPVPAVVGTAIKGSDAVSIARPYPTTSRKSSGSPPFEATQAVAYPASIALPPPTASNLNTNFWAFNTNKFPSL
jgi:hypothetical protein